MAKNVELGLKITPHLDTGGGLKADIAKAETMLSALEDITIGDINTDATEEALRDLVKAAEDIEDALKVAEAEVEKFEKSLEGLDGSQLDELAAQYDKITGDLKKTLDVQEKAKKQLRATGQEGTEAFKNLDAEIEKTKSELAKFGDEAEKAGGNLDKQFALDSLGNLGGQFTELEEKNKEFIAAQRQMAAVTGLTGEALDQLQGKAENAFKRGVGENLAEATRAITAAQSALGSFLNPQEIEDFTVKASGIGRAFDKDVTEVIASSRTLIASFGIEGDKAADLIALGMRDAGGKMDDVLDTLDEYSPLLKEAGFNAEEFVGTITKGVQAGARDTDKLADAIKETQIRLSDSSASNDIKDIGGPIAETVAGIIKAGEAGTKSIKEVMQESAAAIETAFDAGQISDSMRKKLQAAVAGTPAEDIGSELYGKVFGAPIDTAAISAKAKQAGDAITSEAPTGFLGGIGKELEIFQSKASAVFAPVINGAGGVLTAVSGIGPGLVLLQDKFKIFDVAGGFIKALIPKILATVAPLGAQAAATGVATTAQAGLNATMLLNPILLIAAGLAAGVTAFLIFSDSTKDLQEATDDLNTALEESNKAFAAKTDVAKQVVDTKKLADEYDRLKTATDPAGIKRFQEVGEQLAQTFPEATESLNKFDAAGNIVGETFVVATDQVRAFGIEKQALADEEAADALAVLQDEALALVDSYRESTENLADMKAERSELARLESGSATAAEEVEERLKVGILPLIGDVKDRQKDVNKEISEESKKRKEAEVSLRKGVQAMISQGKSAKEIAEVLGLSVEETAKLSGGMITADGSIKKATTSAAGLEAKTKGAATSAQALAEAYAKVKQNADSAFSNSFGAIRALQEEERKLRGDLALINQQKAAGVGFDEKQLAFATARLAQIPGLIAAERKAVKEALLDKKRLEQEELRLNLAIGAVQPNITDFGPQVLALQQELKGMKVDLGLTFNEDGLAVQIKQITKQTDDAIFALNAQIKATQEQVAKGGLADQFEGATEFIRLLGAKVVALGKQRDADILKAQREAAKARLEALKGNLGVELNEIAAALDLQIQRLSTQVENVHGDSIEDLQTVLFLRLQTIATAREKELTALLGEDERYIQTYATLQATLKEIDEAAAAGKLESEIAVLREKARLQSEALDAEEDRVQTSGQAQLAIREKFAQEETKARAETLHGFYAAALVALDKAAGEELKKFLLDARLMEVVIEEVATLTETLGESSIDADLQTKIEALERQRDGELLSLEKFEADKLKIEAEAERKREALQARSDAIREIASNAQAAQELQIQATLLAKKIALAEEHGETAEAKAFADQLDEVQEQIEEKSNLIAFASDKAGEAITASLTNLFTGDEESVKKPFRVLFQTLGGALQTLASAKITEVLLGLIGPVGGLPGFFLTLALKPLISGMIGSFMAPLLNSLLSFSSGGRVDSPTLAIVGDASRSGGGGDREWIFRDDQLRALAGAIAGAASLRSEQIAKAIKDGVSESLGAIEWRLQGSDIVGAVRRTEGATRSRILRLGTT